MKTVPHLGRGIRFKSGKTQWLFDDERKSREKLRQPSVHLGKRLPCKVANAFFINGPAAGTAGVTTDDALSSRTLGRSAYGPSRFLG